MQLPSFLQRKTLSAPAEERARPGPQAALSSADEPPPVLAARVRARRRLIGAVVLLGAGIVVFPLLFETAPRPISVDIPIEIPRKDAVVPLSPPLSPALAPPMSPPPTAAARTGAGEAAKVDLPADAGSEMADSAASAPVSASAPSLPQRAPIAGTAAALKASAATAAKSSDGLRAKALLEGATPASSAPAATAGPGPAPASASASGDVKPSRFVVQVGAFTDANALREARQKVEKLGLKTYTQVIDGEAGKRTRVRVGPFATRDEAEAAGRTLKAAGLPANILTW